MHVSESSSYHNSKGGYEVFLKVEYNQMITLVNTLNIQYLDNFLKSIG